MKESVQFGMNKTPAQMKPKMTADMVDGYNEFPAVSEDISVNAFELRKGYINEADGFGSVPMPLTAKGLISSGVELVKGKSPPILVDKLGQRLAYERSGTRLYDALITKCKASDANIDLDILNRFRSDEAEHFAMVQECIVAIGGDPTAQTPCADASGVMAIGLVQLMTDPRSSVAQCVEAQLTAELTDVAAWDLLIELAEDAGLDEHVTRFKAAKLTEDLHMETMKAWLTEMTKENKIVPVPRLASGEMAKI
jgi:bacterioferritin (cytochrome b1)